MNVKLAVVFLFALVAVCQAQMVALFHTYADASCNATSLIAITATNDPTACLDKKRSVDQISCWLYEPTGFYYFDDFSYCGNDTFPAFPSDWQVVQLTTDSACNSSSNSTFTTFVAAPKNFDTTPLRYASALTSFTFANSNLSCNATSGDLVVGVCWTAQAGGKNYCYSFDLEANVCTPDNSYYAIQSTCGVPPVAVPVAEPVATPTTSTTPTATTTPVKAPSTKTSAASIISGSVVALLSLAAMM